MSTDALTEGVLRLADEIESGQAPIGADPSLEHIPVGTDAVVHQLVYSTMLWESSHEVAGRCMQAIRSGVVDFNELRVCSGFEMLFMLPKECPRKEERAARLLATLSAVFEREHRLALDGVAAMPKREARQYLDGLDGMTPFVAARIMLVTLGGHAFPADGRIARVLLDAGLISPGEASPADLCARLERAVRAADAPRVYALLETAAGSVPARRRRRSTGKTEKSESERAEEPSRPNGTGGSE